MKRTFVLLLWLYACGGTATTTTVRGPDSSEFAAAASEAVVDEGPRFSSRAADGSALAHTLNFAQGTSLLEHPDGGVVVLGCSEGPTDFRGDTQERESLAFVARVDPASGAIVWVRHLRLRADAFVNGCGVLAQEGGASSVTQSIIRVDDEGRVFVTARVQATSAEVLGAEDSVAAGPTVVAFDSDGALLWSRTMGAADAADVVVGMALHPGGGVDVVVRRPRENGLDANAFIHVAADGELSERGVLEASAAPGRRAPCYVGAGGCSARVEWLYRDSDGMLVVYGTAGGVALSFGDDTLTTQGDGLVATGFWASLDSRGRIRWLRQGEGVLTELVDAGIQGVLVNQRDPRSHEEQALFVRPGYGDPRPAIREELRGDAGVALALVERQQRTVPEASVTRGTDVRSLRPTLLDERLAPEDVARLRALAPHGVATRGVRLADGGVVRLENVHGTLALGAATLTAVPRMVGEERSRFSDFLEPSEQPTLALIHWPATPETADTPERSRVLALLTPQRQVHWRVPATAGGGSDGCYVFRVQVSDSVDRQARPWGHLRGTGPRPSWGFTVEADGVRIYSPSISSIASASSAQCETRIAFEDFPHEDATSCQSDPRVFDPGACGPGLASLVQPPEPPRHLLRRLRRRGRVWFSETAEDGSRQCEAWTVRPHSNTWFTRKAPGAAAAGAIVRRERNGNETTVMSLDYRLRGEEVTLLGPSMERFVDGSR